MATLSASSRRVAKANSGRVSREDLSKNPFQPATLAAMALAVTLPEWKDIGTDIAPGIDVETLQQRITALLALRCVAVLSDAGTFKDYAVSTIGKSILKNSSNRKNTKWPKELSEAVLSQLSEFVGRMLQGYKEVPYHNREHAYHVVISVNKLVDLMILSGKNTFGLRNDPLSLLALTMAALIHDVEHQGIPNRQLAVEDDRLAVLYNDQSMAENWSLYVAFSEFLQDEFMELRNVILPETDDYRRFRTVMVNLVLATDIASPERTQIGKSKWKEAFGDPFETVERKLQVASQMQNQASPDYRQYDSPGLKGKTFVVKKRGSVISAISTSQLDKDTSGHEESFSSNDDLMDGESLSGTPESSEATDDNALNYATQIIREVKNDNTNSNTLNNKFERRMSSQSSHATSKYRQRLGILRTVDLSGETLEAYDRRSSHHGNRDSAASIAPSIAPSEYSEPQEEPDDLKQSVIMETFMTASDVAHNLQSWQHMVKWSGRLYLELRRAHVAKRGPDPQGKWFENQIGFLESYLLPVARRLEDTGVFFDETGQMFANIVESNRDTWLIEGQEETQKIVALGAKRYPIKKP